MANIICKNQERNIERIARWNQLCLFHLCDYLNERTPHHTSDGSTNPKFNGGHMSPQTNIKHI